MIIGTVTGEVYSTINHPFYGGRKLLIVTKDTPRGPGDCLVAVDSVGAGVGERVLVLDEGNGARQVLASDSGPVRTVIVGIIDHIDRVDA
ncbi:MAG: EutN/CcmL family microcompartment protein [Bacteroidales bacterium]